MAQQLTTVTLALLITIAAGCESSSIVSGVDEGAMRGERDVAVSVTVEPSDPSDVKPGEVRQALVASRDGTTREEVIYLGTEEPLPPGSVVEEVPEIVAAALAGAPTTDLDERSTQVEMVVESAGGEVQEEVIFVASL